MKQNKQNIFLLKHMLFFSCIAIAINVQAKIEAILPISFYGNAVVKDPVIELNNSFPPPSKPAVCGDSEKCLRAHQGLFNELVTIVEEQEECVKVACKNVAYGYHAESKELLNTFWVYKKDVVALDCLDHQVLETIPHPSYGQESTIVLSYPWKNFSVGTRFKRDPRHDTVISYAIKRADFIKNTVSLEFVPRKNAIVEIKKHNRAARRLFVNNIYKLLSRVEQSGSNNVIPYVWGGSSFVAPYSDSGFYLQNGSWNREGKNDPYSGYDCSEFVMRMAQISGIEFPWKTTSVIERCKKSLADSDFVQEGDLIWIPGHVMIVGNIKNNEVIESRGYKSGYGCVHCFTVNECFENIASYDELVQWYHLKKTIRLKDKQGIVQEKFYNFKLLKLID